MMVSELDSKSSGQSSRRDWGHRLVFLSKTYISHSASLHPNLMLGD